ncbi:MAG: hypothetical protein WC859_04425 [Elusimicrobiota bacterium]
MYAGVSALGAGDEGVEGEVTVCPRWLGKGDVVLEVSAGDSGSAAGADAEELSKRGAV